MLKFYNNSKSAHRPYMADPKRIKNKPDNGAQNICVIVPIQLDHITQID